MIYLDNAATSFPKAPEAISYLNDFVTKIGGNPGRSGHTLSVEAARIIFDAREKLTEFIHGNDSRRLAFTQNGTESLNLALLGLLKQGDHVLTTSLEHNSVMRPLTYLQSTRGIDYTIVHCSPEGYLDPDDIKRHLRTNTRVFIVNHGSNVIGTVQPLRMIKDAIGEIALIVDACQTIGSYPIDVRQDGIDILCFSCHKSLLAIQGLGAIYFRDGIEVTPLKFGGTGSKSEQIEHPSVLPDRYEAGTPNTPAIASLLGALTFLETMGIGAVMERKLALRMRLLERLSTIDGLTIYGSNAGISGIPVLSINVAGKLPSQIGYDLDRRGIYVRVGLHCSPMAHHTIGTFPEGTVRIAPGYFTTDDEIETLVEALREIGG
jgi:cysteine desulfurase / selenocysteine lyase